MLGAARCTRSNLEECAGAGKPQVGGAKRLGAARRAALRDRKASKSRRLRGGARIVIMGAHPRRRRRPTSAPSLCGALFVAITALSSVVQANQQVNIPAPVARIDFSLSR